MRSYFRKTVIARPSSLGWGLISMLVIGLVMVACDYPPNALQNRTDATTNDATTDLLTSSQDAIAGDVEAGEGELEKPAPRVGRTPPLAMMMAGFSIVPFTGPGNGLMGDFNEDGVVDGADLAVWQANYGMSSGVTKAHGDLDFDGDVDGRDMLGLQRYYGATIPAPNPFVIFAPGGQTFAASPTVVWQASANAVSYYLIICADANCATVVRTYEDLAPTATSQVITPPLTSGQYFISLYAEAASATPGTKSKIYVKANNNGLAFTVTPRHQMFATSTLMRITASTAFPPINNLFNGFNGADWQCNRAARNAGLRGMESWNQSDLIFRALLSSPSADAASRVTITAPVVNTFGTRLANNHADLFDGSLLAPVDYDEFGQYILFDPDVWTGSTELGTWSGASCDQWNTSGNGGVSGGLGNAFVANAAWLKVAFPKTCNLTARLYCVGPALLE